MFNNLFDRIEIAGRSFTAIELSDHLANVFGSKQAAGSDDLNHEAYFEFAPYDPIRVEFKDSKFEMSINLKNHAAAIPNGFGCAFPAARPTTT